MIIAGAAVNEREMTDAVSLGGQHGFEFFNGGERNRCPGRILDSRCLVWAYNHGWDGGFSRAAAAHK